jgi:hypothetical protein
MVRDGASRLLTMRPHSEETLFFAASPPSLILRRREAPSRRMRHATNCSKQATAFSRHESPEFCKFICPNKTKGAGKTGCALHPRSRVQSVERDAHEHTGSAEAVRPSLRNGFNGFLRALPGDRLVVTVACGLTRTLDASAGASGPHDFAVRKQRASSSRAFASTASHPDVRDDGQRPLVRDETALNKPVIWVERKRKYFSLRGWTGPSSNWPSGKSLRVFAFIPGSPLKFIRHSPMRNCAPENDERERGRWWGTPSASLRI